MNISKFLHGHSLSAHSFVTFYGIWTAFLITDKTARTVVFSFLDKHPFYSLGFGFAAFAYSRYSGGHSDAGILVEANKIENQPSSQDLKEKL